MYVTEFLYSNGLYQLEFKERHCNIRLDPNFYLFNSIKSITSLRDLLGIELVVVQYIWHLMHKDSVHIVTIITWYDWSIHFHSCVVTTVTCFQALRLIVHFWHHIVIRNVTKQYLITINMTVYWFFIRSGYRAACCDQISGKIYLRNGV